MLIGKNVTGDAVSRIVRNSYKLSCLPDDELEKEFMQELYDETITRLGFSHSEVNSDSLPFFVTDKGIRSLALELAGHEKFQGFFSTYKFGKTWIKKWRELYNVPSRPRTKQLRDETFKELHDAGFYGTPTVKLREQTISEKLRSLKEKLREENT